MLQGKIQQKATGITERKIGSGASRLGDMRMIFELQKARELPLLHSGMYQCEKGSILSS